MRRHTGGPRVCGSLLAVLLTLGCSGSDDANPTDSALTDVATAADVTEPDASGDDAPSMETGPTPSVPAAIALATDLRVEPAFRRTDSRVIFRYRSFLGTRPGSVSAGTSTLDHRVGGDIIANSRGGAGVADQVVTRFDGATKGYLGSQALTVADAVTVDAWFRTSARPTTQTILSSEGFSLAIDPSGKLRGVARSTAGSTITEYEALSPASVADGRWHHASFRARVASGKIDLRLYLDGRLVTEQATAITGALANGASRPAVGAGTTANVLSKDWFAGEITAVEVRNWAVAHDVLASPWLDDGSTYMGRPDFLDSFVAGEDAYARIEATAAGYPHIDGKVRGLYGLPFANDRYVMQGVARSVDPALANRVFLSAYYYDETGDGRTQEERNPNRYPTLIIEADLAERRVARIYRLPTQAPAAGEPRGDTYKAGGLSYLNGTFYVPLAGSVVAYPIAKATRVGDSAVAGGYEIMSFTLAAGTTYTTKAAGDFIDVDPSLRSVWIGEWTPTDGTGRLQQYSLTPEGALASATPIWSGTLIISLNQGLVALGPSDREGFLMTRANTMYSQLVHWDTQKADNPATGVHENVRELARLPRAFEGLDRDADGSIFISTENGSRIQQLGVRLRELHPYLYVLLQRDL